MNKNANNIVVGFVPKSSSCLLSELKKNKNHRLLVGAKIDRGLMESQGLMLFGGMMRRGQWGNYETPEPQGGGMGLTWAKHACQGQGHG